MSELLLVGASGLAREALAILAASRSHRLVGVVDDVESRWGSTIDGVGVIGGLDTITHHPSAKLLICVGHGSTRARIAARLAAAGVPDARYARLIHPLVQVPRTVHVGVGSIVFAGVVMTADVVLGRHVVAMPNVTLTHGNRIDSFVTLCAGVTLGGGVRVGEEAYLGMRSCVRERVRIGARSTLGMGAVLLRDQPAGETWIGVPAAAHTPVGGNRR
ncbi:NeuD/PglB/VioB family sugar acetyltransferase [Microbacteriaceae bacterium VKM Ac-2855]|nr:NeuD/PglB/VioB family sugar acetyltransferase [Microbacteriaceae bacterium VKM Ac-2855]